MKKTENAFLTCQSLTNDKFVPDICHTVRDRLLIFTYTNKKEKTIIKQFTEKMHKHIIWVSCHIIVIMK